MGGAMQVGMTMGRVAPGRGTLSGEDMLRMGWDRYPIFFTFTFSSFLFLFFSLQIKM